ncbi:MAG: hypothetical protein N2515_01340, partial [Deltaproteobacteria bacterium]|nr:hypothetical protein [Deltaproteobacteria bacterium]
LGAALVLLGSEESDAWAVEKLNAPRTLSEKAFFESIENAARFRSEALLERIVSMDVERVRAPLVEWVASLKEPKSARWLLEVAEARPSLRASALAGLSKLGPDAERASRLKALWEQGDPTTWPPELVRSHLEAWLSADPHADLSFALVSGRPWLFDLFVRRRPEEVLSWVGPSLQGLEAAQRHFILRALLSAPSAPLLPWLLELSRDPSESQWVRSRALDAVAMLWPCDGESIDRVIGGPVPNLALAMALFGRRCRRGLEGSEGERGVVLHLRAISGEAVSAEIAERFLVANKEERLLLAHAWLALPRAQSGLIEALRSEEDPQVFEVLALAAIAHALNPSDLPWKKWLNQKNRVLSTLALFDWMGRGLEPSIERKVESFLRDPFLPEAAFALRILSRIKPGPIARIACVLLARHAERPLLPVLDAARFVLHSLEPAPICAERIARWDLRLRALLSKKSTGKEQHPEAFSRILRLEEGEVKSPPCLMLFFSGGRSFHICLPKDGLLVLPPSLGEIQGIALDFVH